MMNRYPAVSVLALALVWGVTTSAGPMPEMRPRTQAQPYLQVAGLFGESDQEKAARLAAQKHEDEQDAGILDLKQRVQDLERALQQSNSQSEQLLHRVSDLKTAVDKMQKDLDYKLCSVTAQLMGVSTSVEAGGISCDGKNTGAEIVKTTLGGASTVELPPTRKAYDDGMKLLARAQYDEALASFRSFIELDPKDDLAPQALYWIGSIALLKRDYAGAAEAFAEGIKKYPKSARVPDNMLKLGQSLIAIGQQKEGCATLAAIKNKFPKGPSGVLSQAANLHAESCK
jgi:tol-pal system protein YbgF